MSNTKQSKQRASSKIHKRSNAAQKKASRTIKKAEKKTDDIISRGVDLIAKTAKKLTDSIT